MSDDTKTLEDKVLALVETDGSHLTDPLVMAAETAKLVCGLEPSGDAKVLVSAINVAVPASATVFERGVALGMCLAIRASKS